MFSKITKIPCKSKISKKNLTLLSLDISELTLNLLKDSPSGLNYLEQTLIFQKLNLLPNTLKNVIWTKVQSNLCVYKLITPVKPSLSSNLFILLNLTINSSSLTVLSINLKKMKSKKSLKREKNLKSLKLPKKSTPT